MGPKKGRRVRMIEGSTDSIPVFELGDTDIQRRKEESKAREREEAQQLRQREEETRREETRMEESQLQEAGQPGPGQKEVTLKHMLLEERLDYHNRITRRGT